MALALKSSVASRPSLLRSSGPVSRPVLCNAVKSEGENRVPVAVASLAAAILMTGAFVPDEALAARSAGRAGGSNFQSRKAAPASTSNTTVSNTTVVVAPPVYASPFGFSPFGFSVFPSVPVFGFGFGFGAMVQLFLIMAVVSVIFGVVSRLGSGAAGEKKDGDKKDGWGEL